MPKGNRNQRCKVCGRRHNADKPCKNTNGPPPDPAPEPEEVERQ